MLNDELITLFRSVLTMRDNQLWLRFVEMSQHKTVEGLVPESTTNNIITEILKKYSREYYPRFKYAYLSEKGNCVLVKVGKKVYVNAKALSHIFGCSMEKAEKLRAARTVEELLSVLNNLQK